MNKVRFFVQMFLAAAVVCLTGWLFDRNPMILGSWGALGLSVLFLIIPGCFIYTPLESLNFFRIAFARDSDVEERKQASLYFKHLVIYSVIFTALMFFVICIYCLTDISSVEAWTPWLYLGIVLPVYSLVFSLVLFLPLLISLEKITPGGKN